MDILEGSRFDDSKLLKMIPIDQIGQSLWSLLPEERTQSWQRFNNVAEVGHELIFIGLKSELYQKISVRSSNMRAWLELGKFYDITFSTGSQGKVRVLN